MHFRFGDGSPSIAFAMPATPTEDHGRDAPVTAERFEAKADRQAMRSGRAGMMSGLKTLFSRIIG